MHPDLLGLREGALDQQPDQWISLDWDCPMHLCSHSSQRNHPSRTVQSSQAQAPPPQEVPTQQEHEQQTQTDEQQSQNILPIPIFDPSQSLFPKMRRRQQRRAQVSLQQSMSMQVSLQLPMKQRFT